VSGVRRDGATWTSTATGTRWVAVIGLEVHAQLSTQTKLFCGCAYRFGAPPNSLTCPVCAGHPGALPVLNAEAVELAVRAGLALGGRISPVSSFDRKQYFYGDVPKNYQISQLDRPISVGGELALPSGRAVRLRRLHLEEDAGKALHVRGDATLVDLNRAGVPLIEAVTEADLETPEEAHAFLVALREVLVFVGASSADLEKGELRCDVNVSVHPIGEAWRTRVEVKNLNSFRHVQTALEHEIERQVLAWEREDPGEHPTAETRLFDAGSGETRPMRAKEGEADYRYLPDPDLPPITLDETFLERQRAAIPELPAARRERYRRTLGLSAYDAGVLTASRDLADFFEAAARLSGQPKEAANWLSNEVLRALSSDEYEAERLDELPIKPYDLADLIALQKGGAVHATGARTILRGMMRSGKAAGQLLLELGLEQVRDEERLERWCRDALEGRDDVVSEVRAGNEKALGALIGGVMQASGGRADPQRVREILKRLISG